MRLIFYISLMNIKIRYKGTFLGLIWTILEPILIFSLLYVVFTNIKSSREEYFAIYLIIGVIFLHLFTRGSMGGLTSLSGNRSILNYINLNKEIFPVANTMTSAIMMLLEIGVFLALIPVFGFHYNLSLIYLPVIMALFLCLILGVSYLLSIIRVYIKDIQPVWGVITYSLIFISPVFWYLKDAQGILLTVYWLNPIAQIIEFSHRAVFDQVITTTEWAYTTSLVLGILFTSYAIFRKLEGKVPEKI
jgi:lipopolysaccharide transport system permease protein